jgi:chromosome segregation ATPase
MFSSITDFEDFIEKMRNKDIIINGDKARSIIVDKKTNTTLADNLAKRINKYKQARSGTIPSILETDIASCLEAINEAYAYGVVEENKERFQQEIKELQRQIKEKDEKIATYLADIDQLKQERDGAMETANKLSLELADMTGQKKALDEKFNRMVPNDGEEEDDRCGA